MNRSVDIRAFVALVVTLVFWASAFAGIRAALEGYGAGHAAFLRFVVASVAFAGYAVVTRMEIPARRDWPKLALAGFLGITVYHLGLTFGERTVSAGAAGFLIATVPVMTALLATVFLKERLSPQGWGGLLLSFLGVAIIAFGEEGGLSLGRGVFLILVAAAGETLAFIVQKPLLEKYNAFTVTAFMMWLGLLFMFPFGRGIVEAVTLAPFSSTLSVIYLGLCPAAIAYGTWAYFLARQPASRAVSILYVSPVLSVIIAWLWLGEVPTVFTVIGGGVTLVGVVVVSCWGRVECPPAAVAEKSITP